ncbi:MAG: DUF3987 domain-containing protein, partial [Gammaproteobacteria bacterium]|nr:DUF3987 domain-containing protein [Gammaproteobacteria bacterium]
MDFSKYKYNQLSEDLVTVLSKKTQSRNKHFFRILTAYYMSKIASMMRTNIKTHDRGVIPINMYALNLMPSGSGKGFSTNIMEEHVIYRFKDNFLNDTFPRLSESQLAKITLERSQKNDTEHEIEESKVEKEFEMLGNLVFSFDSGTSAAIKQMRHKLLMAGAGSMAFEMDEVGSNLLGNMEVLNTFLELYDVGKIKGKLVKNTAENRRSEEIEGKTPCNMMLFGTPSKLLDGDKCESEFTTMLETGYARRLFFGFSKESQHITIENPTDLYDMLTEEKLDATLDNLANKFYSLSTIGNFNKTLKMTKNVALQLLEYKIYGDAKAQQLHDHQEVQKAEASHRYYKALKLAGAYAFVEGSLEIKSEHLEAAILLSEDSGDNFNQLMTRERNYARLAYHISSVGKEVTQVDLMEELPFYKGSEQHKRELMSLAIAFGYQNNIVIKKYYIDNIEFLKGEALKETNLDEIRISYSKDIVNGYIPESVPFSALHKVVCNKGYHYTSHHFIDQYRHSDKALKGFNVIVLDVDEGTSVDTAKTLLKDYTYMIATTKSHTAMKNRFRIILPISHEIKMEPREYTKYMINVFEWLPFSCDEATKDIARKWESHDGQYEYNQGELLDGTLFIPKTKKAEEAKLSTANYGSLSTLEKWFIRETEEGNRSNMLLKYGLVLVDGGYPIEAIRSMIDSFNEKLDVPLSDQEISTTLMITIAKKA